MNEGMKAFQKATEASNFFSPLKRKRAEKMFNSSNKQMKSFNNHQNDVKADFMAEQVQKLQLDLESLAKYSVSKHSIMETQSKPKQPHLYNHRVGKSRRTGYIEGESRKTAFDSVKKKLIFDEDIMPDLPAAAA